jgi:hypothetical protein
VPIRCARSQRVLMYVFDPKRDSALIPGVKAKVLTHAHEAMNAICTAQELLRKSPSCDPAGREAIDALLMSAFRHALGIICEIPDPPEDESSPLTEKNGTNE